MQQKRAPPTIPCQFRMVSNIAMKILGVNLEISENKCTKFGDNPPSGSVSGAPGKSTRQNMSAQRSHFLLGCTQVNMPLTGRPGRLSRIWTRIAQNTCHQTCGPQIPVILIPSTSRYGAILSAACGTASPVIRGFSGVQAGHSWRVGGLPSGDDRKGYQKLPNPIANDCERREWSYSTVSYVNSRFIRMFTRILISSK